jgi:hypothetical protein
MSAVVISLLLTLRSSVRPRAMLHLEILALRHQLHVLERSRPRRVHLTPADRVLWVWWSRVWRDWRAVVIVNPDTSSRDIGAASRASVAPNTGLRKRRDDAVHHDSAIHSSSGVRVRRGASYGPTLLDVNEPGRSYGAVAVRADGRVRPA